MMSMFFLYLAFRKSKFVLISEIIYANSAG